MSRLLGKMMTKSKHALADLGKAIKNAAERIAKKGSGNASKKVFTKSVEYNAGLKGTGITYKVFQRSDINWEMTRTAGDKRGIGLTNAEAASKYGLPPQLNDGKFATLHHSQQRAVGPLFEASTRYHNTANWNKPPLHPYGNKPNPDYPMGNGSGSTRQLFQSVDNKEYWKMRGQESLKGLK